MNSHKVFLGNLNLKIIPFRTLIFASPIHEVCRPSDPFAGSLERELPRQSLQSDLPIFTRLGRSLSVLAECDTSLANISANKRSKNKRFKHHRTLSIEPEHLQFFSTSDNTNSASAQPINGAPCYVAAAAPTHRLTRSLTERKPKSVNSQPDKILLRRSFTDERTDFGPSRRMNLNMETSL